MDRTKRSSKRAPLQVYCAGVVTGLPNSFSSVRVPSPGSVPNRAHVAERLSNRFQMRSELRQPPFHQEPTPGRFVFLIERIKQLV